MMLFELYGRNMLLNVAHFSLVENYQVMSLVLGVWPKAAHHTPLLPDVVWR